MNLYNSCLTTLIVGMGLSLAACGSGGGGTTGGGTTPAATPSSPSPFFQFIRDGSSAGDRPLLVIDPVNAGATPSQLAPANRGAGYMFSGAYAGNLITGLKTSYLVYAAEGKLWKVVSDKTINPAVPGSAGNPRIQISSDSTANVCNEVLYRYHQITDINETLILYELPGPDDCLSRDNNVTRMVKFGDNAATPPTDLPVGLVPTGEDNVFDLTTGTVSHIFFVDKANADALNILNLTTGVVTPVPGIADSVSVVAQDTSDRIFLLNHEATKLYLYTISSNSLVELVSATGLPGLLTGDAGAADSTDLYVVDATTGVVKQVPLSATALGNVIDHYHAPAPVSLVQLSENRIILRLSSAPCNPGGPIPSNEGITSVRKDDKTVFTHLVPLAADTCALPNRTVGSNVFYTKLVGNTLTAHVVTETGTDVIPAITGGIWSGVAGFVNFNTRTNQGEFAKMFLTTSPPSGDINGATVSVYDAANPTNTPLVAGTIPATTVPLTFVDFFGDLTATLGTGQLSSTPNKEIFFLDSAISNSLVRVPTPSARDWFQVD